MVRFQVVLKGLLMLLLVVFIGACVGVDELMEESHAVELGRAESVEFRIDMSAGELRVHGGAEKLMEGYFSYNVDRWRPKVDYNVFGRRGTLSVKQGKRSGIPLGNVKNKWDISLNNDVPIKLDIDFGAGEGRLDLGELKLEALKIDMGVGELRLDLTGTRERDLRVDIDGGVGSGTIYLPEEIGVRVEIDGGIGSVDASRMNKTRNVYTNGAYGRTDVSIEVKIDAGIGSIDLILR